MKRSARLLPGAFCLLFLLMIPHAPGPTPPAAHAQAVAVSLAPVFTGLAAPVFLTHAGDGSGRLFVVEKGGTIRVAVGGVLQSAPFLDIRSLVTPNSGLGEQGLLGLAFHPNFAFNGQFFVYYTAGNAANTLARYRVSATNPNVADPATGVVLFALPDRYANHNGGMLAFGPNDGFLYVNLGDEGSGGDPEGNAQNLQRMFGKILRLDANQNVNTAPYYGIPPSNPFVGSAGALPEVWAYGPRNPWRSSFDRVYRSFVRLDDVGLAGATFAPAERRPDGQVYWEWIPPEDAACVDWSKVDASVNFPQDVIMQLRLIKPQPSALLWILDGDSSWKGRLYEVGQDGQAHYVSAAFWAANQSHFEEVWKNVMPVSWSQLTDFQQRGLVGTDL